MIWAISIDQVPEAEECWNFLLTRVINGTAEREYISKYLFADDRKRSLLSFMMQYAVVKHVLSHVDPSLLVIKRTSMGKPYFSLPDGSQPVHYSVSHHGRYVCIGFDSSRTIGVDLVSRNVMPRGVTSVDEYLGMFRDYFSASEMLWIQSGSTQDEILCNFYVNWALKEAVVKAIGCGIGRCQLGAFDFKFQNTASGELRGAATLTYNSHRISNWRFDYFSIDDSHVIAIARGPISSIYSEKDAESGLKYCMDKMVRGIDESLPHMSREAVVELPDDQLTVCAEDHSATRRKIMIKDDIVVTYVTLRDLIPSTLLAEWDELGKQSMLPSSSDI